MNVAIIMRSRASGTVYQPHNLPREPCLLLPRASLSLWGTERVKRDEIPPGQRSFQLPTCTARAGNAALPLPPHLPKPQRYAPCTLATRCSVQRPCVDTSFNQLFQDRCASLASEQCNYFPSSPLSKSRGFIGLLMV